MPPQPGQKPTNGLVDKTWLGEFQSTGPIAMGVAEIGPEPLVKPAIYRRAVSRATARTIRKSSRRRPSMPGGFSTTVPGNFGGSSSGGILVAQNTTPGGPDTPGSPGGPARLAADSVLLAQPRSVRRLGQDRSGAERVLDPTPTRGECHHRQFANFVPLDISADNIVIWTMGTAATSGETLQPENVPLEIYMEGNIVFRQGERTIYAQRMYYDVQHQIGTVLAAEILSPVPKFAGNMRLKADVLQQTGPGRFLATNAYFTSSRLALPGYRLQAKTMLFEDNEVPLVDPVTKQPQIDPESGEAVMQHDRTVTSRNNLIYVQNVPVFYWPVIHNDVEQSNFYIRQARFKSDHIFGQQFLIDWDAYQVFGLKRLPGTDWTFSTDYFTVRGPAAGTAYRWRGSELFGLEGPYNGFIDAWGIHDHGVDTLGSDRMDLLPEPDRDNRYKVLGRHRQYLINNFQLTGEFGLISDRNFLEQYFEREWDQSKDYDTELMLKQYRGNSTWDVMGTRPCQRLVHADAMAAAGRPLLDRAGSGRRPAHLVRAFDAGYANMLIAARPTDPSEEAKFNWLPWEANVHGGRYFTTQEMDFPFTLGAMNFVPYALGRLAHWDETLQGLPNFRVPDAAWTVLMASSVWPRHAAVLERESGREKLALQCQRHRSQAHWTSTRRGPEPRRTSRTCRCTTRSTTTTSRPSIDASPRTRSIPTSCPRMGSALLRVALRAGQLGHFAVAGNRGQYDGHSPGVEAAWQTERTARQSAHHRHGVVQCFDHDLSAGQSRRLRPGGGPDAVRLYLARGRSGHALVGRHLRLLQRRTADRHDRRLHQSAAAGQRVPGLPVDQRSEYRQRLYAGG